MEIKSQFLKIKNFFTAEIWNVKLENIPSNRKWIYKIFRILFITVWGFNKDNITEKSSNLTYFTLLSIVPVIAMAFGISKGFGLEAILEKELSNFFTGQEEVLNKVLDYSNNMIQSTSGSIITGIGLVILFYTVLRLLYNIEITFNAIWDIKKQRSIHRKLSDYISIIILGLVLILVSSSLTVYIASIVNNLGISSEEFGGIKKGILALLKLIPYAMIWILLFLLYLIFPNTKVKIFPALIAGILAGTAYQLTQWSFINFQFAFSRYNAIYGSLAVLPLFLIYVQLSWFIVLTGAELAFAIQNHVTWIPDNKSIKISWQHRKKISLLIMCRIIKQFEMAKKPLTIYQLAKKINVPFRIIKEICEDLEETKLISMIEGTKEEMQFQPAFDIQKMDIMCIINKLEYDGLNQYDKEKSEEFKKIEENIINMENMMGKSQHNVLLKNI